MVLHSTGASPSVELWQHGNLLYDAQGQQAADMLKILDAPELSRNSHNEILKAMFAKGTVLQVLGEHCTGDKVHISL